MHSLQEKLLKKQKNLKRLRLLSYISALCAELIVSQNFSWEEQ